MPKNSAVLGWSGEGGGFSGKWVTTRGYSRPFWGLKFFEPVNFFRSSLISYPDLTLQFDRGRSGYQIRSSQPERIFLARDLTTRPQICTSPSIINLSIPFPLDIQLYNCIIQFRDVWACRRLLHSFLFIRILFFQPLLNIVIFCRW